MVGRNTADNKFGLTPFIVGQTLGDGCNYAGGTGLQQAINDCFAAGGGVVGVRSSTVPYTVNLTLRSNVDVIAYHSDGRLPVGLNHVEVIGQHTWASATGAAEEIVLSNINFTSTAFGDVFTLNPTLGTTLILGIKFCSISSNSGGGAGRAAVLNPDGTSSTILAFVLSNVDCGQRVVDCVGTGSSLIQVSNGSDLSASADSVIHVASGSAQIDVERGNLTAGTFCIDDSSGTVQILAKYSEFNGVSGVSFTTPGGSLTAYDCIFDASGANYLAGTGTFTHAGTILVNATTLPVTVTETKSNWQPYCSSGTSGTAYRGTAGFDSNQFSVSTTGFVQANGSGIGSTITGDSGGALSPTSGNWNILGLSGSKTSGSGSTLTIKSPPFSQEAGAGTSVLNTGEFVTAAVTRTLPASAGLADGDLFIYVCTTAGALVIQSVGAQKIRIGSGLSSAAGTATSNAIGDSLTLRFNATDGFFYAVSSIGTWTLA